MVLLMNSYRSISSSHKVPVFSRSNTKSASIWILHTPSDQDCGKIDPDSLIPSLVSIGQDAFLDQRAKPHATKFFGILSQTWLDVSERLFLCELRKGPHTKVLGHGTLLRHYQTTNLLCWKRLYQGFPIFFKSNQYSPKTLSIRLNAPISILGCNSFRELRSGQSVIV